MGLNQIAVLSGYGAVVVALTLVGVLVRYLCRTGRGDHALLASATQVAVFLDGHGRAVHASVAALCVAEAVAVGPEGRLSVTGPLPPDASALDAAVHAAAARGDNARSLLGDAAVALAVLDADAAVRRAGLTLSPRRRRWAVTGSWLLLPVLLAGIVLMLVALLRDERLGAFPLAVIVAGVACIAFLDLPKHSIAGERVLARQRDVYGYLRPTQWPSWRTYGPRSAAMAVALFGDRALWWAEPALAGALGLTPPPSRAPSRRVEPGGGAGDADAGCGADSCGGCGSD